MEGLLERERELEMLEEVLDRSGRGEGALVLLAGEAGAGKTSLIRAMRERAEMVSGLGEPAQFPWLQPPPDGPRVPPERREAVERATGMVTHGPPPPVSEI